MAFSFENRSSILTLNLIIMIMLCTNHHHVLVNCDDQNQTNCGEERCGQNGPPIRFPFRLLKPGGPHPNNGCSYPGFNLYCVGNSTALEFQLNQNSSNPIFVAKIDYKSQEIRVHSSSNCLPKSLLSEFNNRSANPIFQFGYRSRSGSNYTLLKCPSKAEQCRTIMVRSEAEVELSRVELFLCSKIEEFRFVPDEIYRMISDGYDGSEVLLRWLKPDCRHCEAKGMRCRLKQINGVTSDEVQCFSLKKAKSKLSPEITISMASSVFFLLVVGASIYFYTLNKNHKNQSQRIEKFLEDYAALKPSRYSFADIKKITNNFEDMVGQGTYGTVFKGKLSNDIFVAVKILNNSQGNGDDFINEVAAMNQIYHVNVVRLVGYCADGCRRALIYEFLSNNSLEKYISSSPSLSWEALYNIALGIAKGIEYLHQGCDKRILHFDIKPRNILLDHNFIPKISDFGLAKLCSKDQSAVSMKTARGTIGYIAPEVLSRNFGNVSYKSDVYSFGILLLEIVGRRKNTSANEEDVDEIYYPEWIYNLLEEGDDFRIFIEEEGNSEIIKKLAIVGLWCIQWHPINRPTMKFVIQMFEEESELTIPPNPFASLGSSRENTKNPSLRVPFELEAIAEEA